MRKWILVLLTFVLIVCMSTAYANDGYFVEYTTKAYEGEETDINDLVMDTMLIIRDRLDSVGIVGYRVVRIGMSGIRVEIPYDYCGLDQFSDLLDLIGTPGELRFLDPQGNVFMTGDMVKSAEYEWVEGDHQILFTLTDEGAQIFADMTAKSIGMVISVYLDEKLILAPVVQAPITEGAGMINGLKSAGQAKMIAAKIQSGNLPLELTQDRIDYWAELPQEATGEQDGSAAIEGSWRIISASGEGTEEINEALSAGLEVLMVFHDGVLTIESPFIGDDVDTSQRYRTEGNRLIWIYEDGSENSLIDFSIDGETLQLLRNGEVMAILERR